MRTIFIGGPGRSGTSFVADRLASHSDISAFRDVELKLFTEKNGLLDLWHSLLERYSPNRAAVARQQFLRLTDALIAGQFGQPGFKAFAPIESWESVFKNFLKNALPSGEFERTTTHQFRQACRQLLLEIAQLSRTGEPLPKFFLEKTPHALLAPDFLTEIAPDARLIHVMRDPRSIAQSLRGMGWGPDDLGDCCAWISGYCSAWLDAQKTAASLGLKISRFFIEDIARNPDECAVGLCDAIGTDVKSDLFRGASTAILNGWVNSATDSDLLMLNRRLLGWVHHFGYSPERIGHRMSVDAVGTSHEEIARDTPPAEPVVAELF